MLLQFFLQSFFVESLPVNDDSVTQESGVSSNRIKLKVRGHQDQCPEDESSFCEGEICGNWICLEGAQEHNSCELDFVDDAAGENITEIYRTCSCHTNIGAMIIFVGCKWKSSEIRPDNLKINDEYDFFEASGEPVVLEQEFMTPSASISEPIETQEEVLSEAETTIEEAEIEEEEISEPETEQNFMLFDVEEAEQTSDISQIFTGSFLNCLRALPGQAEILCRLEESTRPCEITCGDETEHNVCLCDADGCFWRNKFNRKCNSFEEPVHHEEAIREIETVRHKESALNKLKFEEMKNDEGKYKTILGEDGTYVHGYDLMLGLIQEMYDNGLMQK